jgi:hypothetical protein
LQNKRRLLSFLTDTWEFWILALAPFLFYSVPMKWLDLDPRDHGSGSRSYNRTRTRPPRSNKESNTCFIEE